MNKIPSNPADASPALVKQIIGNTKLRRQVTKNSHLWFFYIYFGGYVTRPIADFHREIFAMTERDDEQLSVLTAFRGSAKSTLVTLSYVLWSIFGKQQKKFVLVIGLTQPQAGIHFMNIRVALEENELLGKDFGPYTLADGEWGSSTIVLSRYSARISVASIDKTIRGIRHKQYRPDLIILDDVEDLSSVKTQESRDYLHNWFQSEIQYLGDIGTRIIVVGNLLHRNSLLMRLKDAIASKKIDGGYYEFPLVDASGKILWLGKYPNMAAVEREKRKTDPVIFHREFLLEIISSVDQVVHPEWIHTYFEVPQEVREDYHQTLIGVDMAIAGGDKADFTAMVPAVVAGRGADLKIYILPVINQRMTFPQMLERIEALNVSLQDNYPVKFIIEANAQQEALVQQLNHIGVTCEGVKVATDKRSRIALTTDLIKSGKIRFPLEGAEKLIDQLTNFGYEKHDDLADAFSLLINYIIRFYKPPASFSDFPPIDYSEGDRPITAGLLGKVF